MIIYGFITTVLFTLLLPIYYIVRVCNGKFLYGWREKLGFFPNPRLGNKVILYHGVSVGEIIALENLIKETKKSFPEYKIVVTTGTKTGQEIAKKKFANLADYITYFPFDISYSVAQFLRKIRPTVVLIAETEIWPIFASQCKKRKIPLYTINGRISDATFHLYRIFSRFFGHVLSNYAGILTQSNDDMQKLIALGAPKDKISVMRNLKFDVKKSDEHILINKNDGDRIIIAGSTHKEENPIVINTFYNLKQKFKEIKLLIAPRHTKRVPEIITLLKAKNLTFGLRSKNNDFTNNEVIILDTMGELSKAYELCHLAFIGGSFNKTGGHNPLEAVVYSKPAISGPNIHNFRDIYYLLGKTKAGKVVKTPHELTDYMETLLTDEEYYNSACKDCNKVFEYNKGALFVVIDTLKNILT